MVAAIDSYEEFQKLIANEEVPVFIDFWATWCGPCKQISPIFNKLAGELDDKAKFFKVDVDEQDRVAEEVGIRVMPTFIAFKGGKKLDSFSGAIPNGLTQFIHKHIASIALCLRPMWA